MKSITITIESKIGGDLSYAVLTTALADLIGTLSRRLEKDYVFSGENISEVHSISVRCRENEPKETLISPISDLWDKLEDGRLDGKCTLESKARDCLVDVYRALSTLEGKIACAVGPRPEPIVKDLQTKE